MKILIEKKTAIWFSQITKRLNDEIELAQKRGNKELYDKLDYILWGSKRSKQTEVNRILQVGGKKNDK